MVNLMDVSFWGFQYEQVTPERSALNRNVQLCKCDSFCSCGFAPNLSVHQKDGTAHLGLVEFQILWNKIRKWLV